jgi:2,5-dioxopentanoate dehydrogenase
MIRLPQEEIRTVTPKLTGRSLVVGGGQSHSGVTFRGINPRTGEALAPDYVAADRELVDRAVAQADQAFAEYRTLSGKDRSGFLRAIAANIEQATDALAERIGLETALPDARARGEAGRTTSQLRLFADLIEENSWVEARIDPALPDRQPQPRADIRATLRPLGPVAVFGASNFPLAFSVGGGDTASALAAGCPVVFKAHPAHPGTSEIVGRCILDAAEATGMPPGVFALLFDNGIDVGKQLVQHPGIKAAGFTGSLSAGRSLYDLAAARDEPIPVYAEMGSVNPQFCLPAALGARAEAIAEGLFQSFTMGVGQFCTKPGIVFYDGHRTFVEQLTRRVAEWSSGCLLTYGIAQGYENRASEMAERSGVATLAQTARPAEAAGAIGRLLQVDLATFIADPKLREEMFGPGMLLVRYDDPEELIEVVRQLPGQLAASLHADPADFELCRRLTPLLEQRVGRVVYNQFPTGVEVTHAMVHGGPYPATTDSRATSVGTLAIRRFARAVCYQNMPEELLPAELQSGNPLGIRRLVNGAPE